MTVTVKIEGLENLKAKLDRLSDAVAGQKLLNAANAGALPIQNAGKDNSPYLTGTNMRSIHTEPGEVSRERAEVLTGPSTPYGRRLELGFVGEDSLGRAYNQPARPYMRPAFDEHKDEAVDEVARVLKAEILRAI